MRKSTPWGMADHEKELADGIVVYSTPSHGGIHLSPERQKVLQRAVKFNTFAGGPWYEEDCDVAVVYLVFHEEFALERVKAAFEAAQTFRGWEARDGRTNGNWHKVVKWAENNPCIQDRIRSDSLGMKDFRASEDGVSVSDVAKILAE